MVKHGSVSRIDTDHALVIWDDGSFSLLGFQDEAGKAYSQGDRVTFYPQGHDWWVPPKTMIDPKPSVG
jgi:hypothetical protein